MYEKGEGAFWSDVGLKCQRWSSCWTKDVDFGFPFAHYRLEPIDFEDEDGFGYVDLPLIHFDDVSAATVDEIVTQPLPSHTRIRKMKTLSAHNSPRARITTPISIN